jgi:hypothetical protein
MLSRKVTIYMYERLLAPIQKGWNCVAWIDFELHIAESSTKCKAAVHWLTRIDCVIFAVRSIDKCSAYGSIR